MPLYEALLGDEFLGKTFCKKPYFYNVMTIENINTSCQESNQRNGLRILPEHNPHHWLIQAKYLQ